MDTTYWLLYQDQSRPMRGLRARHDPLLKSTTRHGCISFVGKHPSIFFVVHSTQGRFLAVLVELCANFLDVHLLGVFLAHSFAFVPSTPLCLAFKREHAGPRGVVVTHG